MHVNYDLLIIGTGTAAKAAAFPCRAQGWKLAVIDHQPFGGTCALRGCDPKKVLVAAAEAMDAVARLRAKQVIQGEVHIDWQALQAFKHSFTDGVPDRVVSSFQEKGIDTYQGKARFTGPNRVQVGDETLQAEYVLIATGAEPASLPVTGAEHLIDSTQFLALRDLPRRIVFVGGGYVGFEFAHIVARAGARASILNRGPQPLKQFDPQLVEFLADRTRALGVDILNEHSVEKIQKYGEVYTVHADTPAGAKTLEADLVVNSGGRVPAVRELGLEPAEISNKDGAIELNEYLQSVSNPAVYVAGDAAKPGPPLTPVAAMQGQAVAANLLHGNHVTLDYRTIPSAVFTVPVLAGVGLQAAEADAEGLDYQLNSESVPEWYTARRVNESAYAYKVLVEKASGRLLGAQVIGPDAAELINLFALAMKAGLTAAALKETRFVYPTAATDIRFMLP